MNVETHGQIARSIHTLVDALVDEAQFDFTEDGFSVEVVDPTNVACGSVQMPPDAFETYDAEDTTVGVPLSNWGGALAYARKGRGNDLGDPVSLSFTEETRRFETTTTREDEGTRRETTLYGIDPGSMRDQPDIPDLDLPGTAHVGVETLVDAVVALREIEKDAIRIQSDDDAVRIGRPGGGNDYDSDVVVIEDAVVHDTDDADAAERGSLFSMDYFRDVVAAIDAADMGRVVLSWGREFPVFIHAENNDWGLTAEYTVAPRIEAE